MKLDVKNPQLFARFVEGSLPGKLHWGLDFQGVSIGKEKIKAWFGRRYHVLPRPGDFGQLSNWFFYGCFDVWRWGSGGWDVFATDGNRSQWGYGECCKSGHFSFKRRVTYCNVWQAWHFVTSYSHITCLFKTLFNSLDEGGPGGTWWELRKSK